MKTPGEHGNVLAEAMAEGPESTLGSFREIIAQLKNRTQHFLLIRHRFSLARGNIAPVVDSTALRISVFHCTTKIIHTVNLGPSEPFPLPAVNLPNVALI
ncbi:hypothetical protein HRG84_20345 [Flavisolibacter sp. BT320]|nr:hypothetical protein [Flavisolibacter longurius]